MSLILRERRTVAVLLISIIFVLYMILVTWNSSSSIEVWPLEGIFWETVIVIVIIGLLSYLVSSDIRASVIIPLTIQTTLVIFIPVLKYPNALNIVGAWDSVAHYSFAKWIIINGHVDIAGNLYYSGQYGYHPGNGILPAILSLLSSIDLGLCMNVVLVTVYLGYILLGLALIDEPRFSIRNINKRMNEYLWLYALFTLVINQYSYYRGEGLGYIYAGSVLFILSRLITKKTTSFKVLMSLVIIFLGLLSTHLSTAIIVTAYLFIVILTLLIMGKFSKLFSDNNGILRKLIICFLMIILVFVVYEAYVDAFLLGATLKGALRRIYSLYVEEIMIASTAMEVKGVTFIDLLRYLISTYAKIIIILGLSFIHTIILLTKYNSLNNNEKIFSILLFISYFMWLIGWAGVGSFIQGYRALSLISFLLILNLILTHGKLYRSLAEKTAFAVPTILLTVLGFIASFGLPFQPTVRSGEDSYVNPTRGIFNDLVLHPVLFVSAYDRNLYFICLEPYISFGICDLMWQTPRIPRHGFISPPGVATPEGIIDVIRSYLGKQVIVPQPLKGGIISVPIRYYSLYKRPFHFLLGNGIALVYNNGAYTLFLV